MAARRQFTESERRAAVEAFEWGMTAEDAGRGIGAPGSSVRVWAKRSREAEEQAGAADEPGRARACECGGFALPDEDDEFRCLRCARAVSESQRANGFDEVEALMMGNRGVGVVLRDGQRLAVGKGTARDGGGS